MTEQFSALAPMDRGPVDVRTINDGDTRFVSVSSIVGSMSKGEGLLYWAAEQAAQRAVDIRASLDQRVTEDGEQAVVKQIRNTFRERVKDRRTAAELGSAIHHACEMYALSGTRPDVDDEVAPFLDRFDEWAQVAQPTYEAAELTVFNRTYGYAGTADAFMVLDGMRVLADYKTSRDSFDHNGKPRTPYPEAALQLAGLRYCDLAATWRARRYHPNQFTRRTYLLSAEEIAMADKVPEVEAGVIIHITPEHCTCHPMICDERMYDSFLHVLEVYRWQDGLAKVAVGPAIDYGSHITTNKKGK